MSSYYFKRLALTQPNKYISSCLLRDIAFSEKFDRILYCIPSETHHAYGQYLEKLREACTTIEVIPNFPDFRDLRLYEDITSHKLVILGTISSV